MSAGEQRRERGQGQKGGWPGQGSVGHGGSWSQVVADQVRR